MNKNDFEKGTKRKCASCSTLFYDFDKQPLICPNCGAEVNMLTNVSKRGRPPKSAKVEENLTNSQNKKNELDIEGLEAEEETIIPEEVIDDDDENVENIIQIDKDKDENT